MQNNHPKSEASALKEAAAQAKNQQARQKSVEKEKTHHDHLPDAKTETGHTGKA
jgi:hypothetical protein